MINTAAPFVFPLISLISGIYVQSLIHCPIIISGLLLCTLIPVLFYFRNNTIIARYIITIMFFVTGMLVLMLQQKQSIIMRDKLVNKNLGLLVTVTDKIIRDQNGELLELSVEGYRDQENKNYTPISCTILCYTHYPTNIQVGDRIEFEHVDIKKTIHKNSLTGNPTYDDYLIKEDVVAAIFMNNKIEYTIQERPKYSINRWLWNKRQQVYTQLKHILSKTTFTYFSLIFLGNKQHIIIDDLRKTFNYWGLSHYLARSGLHIVLFIIIWQFILSLIPINFFLKRLLLLLICIIYNFLSSYSIPFARAYFAFLLIETGRLCNRQTYYLHILTLICTLILLFNPMQLFFLDFQLTFALTFALVWIGRILQRST